MCVPIGSVCANSMVAEHVRRMLGAQVQLVLATVSHDGPATHLMAYAAASDLTRVWLATPRTARKAANMIHDPRVSMLWDNRCIASGHFRKSMLCSIIGHSCTDSHTCSHTHSPAHSYT